MERLKFNPRKPAEHVRRLAAALKRGPALVPALGGIVALGRGPAGLAERFGAAFRLVNGRGYARPGGAAELDERFRRVLDGPAAGRFPAANGWSGVALAGEPLLRALLERVPEAGVGLLDEDDVESVIEDGELAMALAGPGPAGPGPTVVDFRPRPVLVERKGAMAVLELEARLGETVRLGPGVPFWILVVCTGNMCRSPMAHGILARLLDGERAFVFSAGTDAPAGSPPTRSAVEVAAEHGADISRHRARQLEAEQIAAADLVLVMEDYHRRRMLKIAPDAGSKVRLLGEYLPGAGPGREIGDPVGLSRVVYQATAAEIRTALEKVAEEVRQRFQDAGSVQPTGQPETESRP